MSDFTTWRSLVDGEEIGVIPDSEIYLQDDWGDNKLQDRDGSATTTHNGVEGVYRPEYVFQTTDENAEATDERLEVTGNTVISADINLNLDETITWEFDVQAPDGSLTHSNVGVFSETTDITDERRLKEGYEFRIVDGANRFQITDSGGSTSSLIDAGSISFPADITIIREPSGDWELLVNGTSQGETTDTTFTEPLVTYFGTNSDNRLVVDEYKVF